MAREQDVGSCVFVGNKSLEQAEFTLAIRFGGGATLAKLPSQIFIAQPLAPQGTHKEPT